MVFLWATGRLANMCFFRKFDALTRKLLLWPLFLRVSVLSFFLGLGACSTPQFKDAVRSDREQTSAQQGVTGEP